MAEKLSLRPGEELLFHAPVSLVTGKLATRTGVCYLTNQRVVVSSESVVAGAAAAVSILSRSLLRKTKALGNQRREIPLKTLGRVSVGKYGMAHTVDFPLADGSQLRLAMGKKLEARFFEAFDRALASQGWERVAEDADSWRIRPKL